LIKLKSRSASRSSAFCSQLTVNDSTLISSDASNLIEPNMANSKEDFVDVDELGGRKLVEFEEPMPSLIVSASTRDYGDVQLDEHKRLRRRITWIDNGHR
jgi:hypothetical protein